ncbi:MAG: S41 family peptidase [Bdellovibrionales bacterium]
MLKVVLSFVVVFSLFQPALVRGQEAREVEKAAWQGLGLKINFLEPILNPNNCYKTKIQYLGCIKALQTLLRSGAVPRIVGNDQIIQFLKTNTLTGLTLAEEKNFGTFKVMSIQGKRASEKLSYMQYYKKYKAIDQQEEKLWLALFSQPTQILPIAEMLSWIGSSVLTPETGSQAIGSAYGMYTGTSVDAHGYLLPYSYYSWQSKSRGDSFVGIGASVTVSDGLKIEKVFDGSGALAAGLWINDVIVKVDGKDITQVGKDEQISFADAIKLLRGTAKTTAALTVLRSGKYLNTNVVRQAVQVPNVSSKILRNSDRLTKPNQTYGYMKLTDFRGTSCDLMAVEYLKLKDTSGLILDLRGNGGGELSAAQCIASLFLEPGKLVVSQIYLNGQPREDLRTENPIVAIRQPLVLLVDSNSASASEILAGDLQDYGRALLVGVRTFGKGTVQGLVRLPSNPSILKAQTIARFYLPGFGPNAKIHTNQIVGIAPDIEAYKSPIPTEEDKFILREADLFPNALSGQQASAVAPDAATGVYYQNCVKTNGVAAKKFAAHVPGPAPADYQLFVALDALSCKVNAPK